MGVEDSERWSVRKATARSDVVEAICVCVCARFRVYQSQRARGTSGQQQLQVGGDLG